MATYKRLSGAANDKGTQFELKLAALLYLGAINSADVQDFKLATNMDGAGALDDVVFKTKSSGNSDKWVTSFVQLKHKEGSDKSVGIKDLKRMGKNDFSLFKYYKSFIDIEKEMSKDVRKPLFEGCIEDCRFIIYTNAKLVDDLKQEGRTPSGSVEDLFSSSGMVFSLDSISNEKVNKNMYDFLTEELDKEEKCEEVELKKKQCENVRRYLKNLHLFCSMANEKKCDNLIKAELKKVKVSPKFVPDLDILYSNYLKDMKDWCESHTGTILDKGSNLVARAWAESFSQQQKKDLRLDVVFEPKVISSLRNVLNDASQPWLLVECSESSCRLSGTKVLDAFIEDSFWCFDVDHLAEIHDAVTFQWLRGRHKTFVIVFGDCDKAKEAQHLKTMKKFSDVPVEGERVVMLSPKGKLNVEQLFQVTGKKIHRHLDSFKFAQINEVGQNKIFNTNLNLQGCEISLETFLDGKAGDILEASLVVDIIQSGYTLSVGLALGQDIDYYVPRTLECRTTLKDSLFSVSHLPQGVTIAHASTDDYRFILLKHKATRSGLRDARLETRAITKHANKSIGHEEDLNILNQFSRSPMSPDPVDQTVFIGGLFKVNELECNYVSLRYGQINPITALRMRTHLPNASKQGWFLFILKGTDEQDIKHLSKFNKSQHLLNIEDSKLTWVKSDDKIDFIRAHIDHTQATPLSHEDVTKLEDRLTLVTAEPGMGKSTLLRHLAKTYKEAHPHFWTIMITLNDHTKLFSQDKHKDSVEFLSAALGIKSRLDKSLLKMALEDTGNVVLLLDGVDEVAPTYFKKCCELVSSLMKTKVKTIWITSRNSQKRGLEENLERPTAELRKFDGGDQKRFLQHFWKSKSTLSEGELDAFITSLLKKTSQAISDRETDFTGIPLQTRMMAEVFEDQVALGKTELPDKLDLLDLLDQFVEKKLKVYVEDKLGIEPSDTSYVSTRKTIEEKARKSHLNAALVLIISDNDLSSLHSKRIKEKWSKFAGEIQSAEDKTGLIEGVVEGKPRFLHRVYAEYFTAHWFAKNLAENLLFLENHLFSDNFAVVRNMLDRMLAKDCKLRIAVLKEDVEEIRKLLEEGVDFPNDLGGRTALHLAAAFGPGEDKAENARRSEILDLLIDFTKKKRPNDLDIPDKILNGSPLRYADVTKTWIAIDKLLPCNVDRKHLVMTSANVTNPSMLENIFTHDLDNLLAFCLDQGLSIEHSSEGCDRRLSRACQHGSMRVATLLIDKGADIKMVHDELSTPMHVASEHGHVDIVQLLQDTFITTLHDETITRTNEAFGVEERQSKKASYVNLKDKKRRTALHCAAMEGYTDVVSVLVNLGTDVQSHGGKYKGTALHLAACSGHLNVITVLLDALVCVRKSITSTLAMISGIPRCIGRPRKDT